MSSIGGPGGVGGPKGPEGPGGVGDVGDVEDAGDVGDVGGVRQADAAGLPAGIESLAADIAAGKLTPREAVERLVDEIAGTDDLAAADRAELREMITDLVENDPYLSSLVGRV